jgi:hypothetical protein
MTASPEIASMCGRAFSLKDCELNEWGRLLLEIIWILERDARLHT